MTIEEYAMENGISFVEAQKRMGEDMQEEAKGIAEGEPSKKERKRRVVDE